MTAYFLIAFGVMGLLMKLFLLEYGVEFAGVAKAAIGAHVPSARPVSAASSSPTTAARRRRSASIEPAEAPTAKPSRIASSAGCARSMAEELEEPREGRRRGRVHEGSGRVAP